MPRFAIPFTLATTLGLAAVALTGDPSMRTLTPADVSAGLPASAAATALLGKAGAAVLLVLLFLAVTSATSAELIAVSSILTYDIYKVTILVPSVCWSMRISHDRFLQKYINPHASEAQVLKVSHAMVSFLYNAITSMG